jgi:hypothetical protein
MRNLIRFSLILSIAGMLTAVPTGARQQAQKQEQKQQKEEPGMAEAIRFERAKQAAADRQAQLEEQSQTANREKKSTTKGTAAPAKKK